MTKAKGAKRFEMSGLSQWEELPLQVIAAVLGQLIRKQHTDSKGASTHWTPSVWQITQKRVGKANPQREKYGLSDHPVSERKKYLRENVKNYF